MSDWYMLLAPLVALPIILLFAFVGCQPATGPSDPGFGLFGPPEPKAKLIFNIFKADPLITNFTCTFSMSPSFFPHPLPSPSFTSWTEKDVETGALELTYDAADQPVQCRCEVEIFRVGQGSELLGPVTSLEQTAEDFVFRLDVPGSGLWFQNS